MCLRKKQCSLVVAIVRRPWIRVNAGMCRINDGRCSAALPVQICWHPKNADAAIQFV
jgi:hypothetical protein